MLSYGRLGSRPGLASVAVLVAAVGWAGTLLSVRDHPVTAQTLSNVGLSLIALCAGIGSFRRALRHTGADRRFWLLLGAAMTSWSMGQAVWSWFESVLGREVPFPSPADLGYLGLPPLAAAALLALPLAAQTTAGKLRTVFDGLMVAASLLLCSWILVLRHVFDAGADSLTSAVISLAYPVGDVVLITMVTTTWLRSRRTARQLPVSLPLVGSGLLAFAVADSGFTYETSMGVYSSGSIIDLGWFAGFSLILLASLRPMSPAEAPAEDEVGLLPLGSLLPYAAVTTALLTSGFEVLRTGHSDLVVSWLRTGIMVLLVGRQLFTLLENQSLTRTLEDRVHARTAELTASRERFSSLVQHSSDIVTMIDPQGVVGYQSASIRRILGHSAEEVEGSSIYALMGPTDAAVFEQAIAYASAEELRIHTIMSSWRHADGHECRVEVTITNLMGNPHLNA